MRRRPGRVAAAVHHLLGWLHRTAPGLAPRPVSLDADEWVVEHVPGDVSGVPFAPFLLRTGALASVGRLLRRVHEATARYRPPAGTTWAAGAVAKSPGDVVCHGDVGAGNVVWRSGEAVALIDWELAEPGPPVRDLALAAWTLVPLVPPDRRRRAGIGGGVAERLAALCEGYGRYPEAEVLAAYRRALDVELARRRELGGRGVEPWAHFAASGQIERIEATAAWFDASSLAP